MKDKSEKILTTEELLESFYQGKYSPDSDEEIELAQSEDR